MFWRDKKPRGLKSVCSLCAKSDIWLECITKYISKQTSSPGKINNNTGKINFAAKLFKNCHKKNLKLFLIVVRNALHVYIQKKYKVKKTSTKNLYTQKIILQRCLLGGYAYIYMNVYSFERIETRCSYEITYTKNNTTAMSARWVRVYIPVCI
jgi:hypothetical protein